MEETDIKDRIIRGAEELFLRYSFRSVSMDDVARHLSVSKKTLYQYFADKDELVTQVALHHMSANQQQYDALRAEAENAIDELFKISVVIKRDLQRINPAALMDLQKYHPKGWAVWLAHKEKQIYQSVIANLKQGVAEGFYRPDINVEVLAMVRLEQIELGLNGRAFPADRFNLAEVSVQIFEHFVYGLLTDKGRKIYEKYKQNISQNETNTSI